MSDDGLDRVWTNGAVGPLSHHDRSARLCYGYLADCYEAQSNYVAAIDEYMASYLGSGYDTNRVTAAFTSLRKAYDTTGPQGYFRKWIEIAHAQESLPESERFIDQDIAGYYVALGEKDKALKELEDHFNDPNLSATFKFLPLHDNLRDEPRFKALVKRAGLEK